MKEEILNTDDYSFKQHINRGEMQLHPPLQGPRVGQIFISWVMISIVKPVANVTRNIPAED